MEIACATAWGWGLLDDLEEAHELRRLRTVPVGCEEGLDMVVRSENER